MWLLALITLHVRLDSTSLSSHRFRATKCSLASEQKRNKQWVLQHKYCGTQRDVQLVFIAYGRHLQMKIYVQVMEKYTQWLRCCSISWIQSNMEALGCGCDTQHVAVTRTAERPLLLASERGRRLKRDSGCPSILHRAEQQRVDFCVWEQRTWSFCQPQHLQHCKQ